MAKRISRPAGLTSKQMSRAKREATIQRWLLIGTATIVVAVVGIIAFAFINDQILVPGRAIATINDDKITIAEFQEQAEFTWYQQLYPQLGNEPLSNYGIDGETFSQYILDAMVDDTLIHQKATEKGIAINDADVEERIELYFGYDAGEPEPTSTPITAPTEPGISPTTTSTPVYTLTPRPTMTLEAGVTPTITPTYTTTPTGKETPTPTSSPQPTATPVSQQAFTDFYTQWAEMGTQVTSLSTEKIETLLSQQFRSQLLREELIDALDIEVDSTKLMIHAAHILVASEEEADTITERLSDGEEFETLAAELSLDPTAYKGGDLGWFGPGQMDPAFEDTAKDTPVGEVSAPVETQYGWHLIKVYARTEVTMTPQEQQNQRQEKFRELLEEWRDEENVIIESFWVDYLPPQLWTPTATPMLLP